MQPADSPFEFELAVAFDVQILGRRVGGGDQFDVMFVQRVDQRDEARRCSLRFFGAKTWNADEDDAVIAPGDGEIIARPARLRRTAA